MGPTNNWAGLGLDEGAAAGPLHGAMTGHTLYVIPYSMGARRLAHIANIGVELTGGDRRAGRAGYRWRFCAGPPLGDEEQIHLRAGTDEIVALISSTAKVRPGDVLDLRVPLDRVHMFDAASGLSLTSRQLVAA